MFSFLKKLFMKNQPGSAPHSEVSIRNYQKEKTVRIGIPADPIPNDYLEELRQQFSEVGLVNRAAYGLMEVDGDFSFMIALDLEVPSEQKQKTVADIAIRIRTHGRTPYRGRWPLDFMIWNDSLIQPVLAQMPSFGFFKGS
ncbi:MAG: enhanced serine sensitivity protein SseB C-terminal domain-containing protein [Pseudobdellovibrionaceae bacterium]